MGVGSFSKALFVQILGKYPKNEANIMGLSYLQGNIGRPASPAAAGKKQIHSVVSGHYIHGAGSHNLKTG